MNEQTKVQPVLASISMPTGSPTANREVPLDISHLTTTYANYFHACGSPRELILDFGLHSGLRMSSGPEPVHITQRLIMPMTTAKQLLEFLHMLIRTQENAYGPIQGMPPRSNSQPSNPPNPPAS